MKLFLRALSLWFGIFIVAIINGTIRELVIKQFIEEPWAHHLSALSAIILISILVAQLWSKVGVKTSKQAALIGVSWFVGTVLVETFVLGRSQPWNEVIQNYNLLAGNLWPIVLLCIGILPSLMFSSKRHTAGIQ